MDKSHFIPEPVLMSSGVAEEEIKDLKAQINASKIEVNSKYNRCVTSHRC